MLLRLLKNYGTKEIKAVVDAYPCDGDMAKNQTVPFFNWAER